MTDAAPPAAAASSGGGAATPTYRPHKMERYYAQHLLQTHFSSDNNPTAPADFSHTTTASLSDSTSHSIHVPDRTAVPFLTTSGVSRDTLKQIWNVVDPGGLGTLICRSQFHAMLRLVALEEAGLLPPLPASGADAGNVLTDALTKYSHLEITLPTFDAVQMPSAAFLVGTYRDVVKGQDEAPTESHHVWEQAASAQQQQNSSLMSAQYRQEQMAGVGMAGGMMTGGMGMMSPMQPHAVQMQQNPMQPNQMMQQQPHKMGITNTTASMSNNIMMAGGGASNIKNASYHSQPSGASGGGMMSVGDAFADLDPSEDRVLPSDDFGDFEEADEALEEAVEEEAVEEEVQEEIASVEVDAAATANNVNANGAAEATVPSQPQMDGLGGNDGMLEGAPPPPPLPMGMDMGMEGMGAPPPPPPLPTGPPPSQPPPMIDDAEPHEEGEEGEDNDDDEGFGDFEGMDDGANNVEATATSSTADDFTSDFGAAASMPPPMPPPAVPSEPAVSDTVGGAAGIGEFGAGTNAFGEQTAADPLSVSDAFAVLGPSSDAPLPAEPFGAPEPQTINTDGTEEQEEDDDDDDDGFGDFGAADGAGHDGGDTAILDENALETADKATDLPAQTPAEADDSFGGFEDHSQPLPSTTDAPQEATSDDPFAALGPAEDTPLPADPFGSTEAVADTANDGIGVTEEGNYDADGFGAFEAVQAPDAMEDAPVLPSESPSETAAPLPDIPPPLPPTDVQAEADFQVTSEDPFSVIGPAEDAPLPILSMDTADTSPSDEPIADVNDLPVATAKAGDDDDDDDDDFGSFEEVEADEVKEPATDDDMANDPQIVSTTNATEAIEPPMDVPPPLPAAQEADGEAPTDDPFAVLGPSSDAPLPVLSYGSTEAEATPDAGTDDNDDDDFGEFEEIPESDLPPAELGMVSPSDGLVAAGVVEEAIPDALNGEENTNAAEVVPDLPSAGISEDVAPQVLDVPVPPPPPAQVQDMSPDDPFSVLGPQQDAPLPVLSFGSAASGAADTPADAFGTVSGDENDDEDFGAFETNPSNEGIGMTAEGMVEPAEAAPVTTENESDDDDDFGDFGGGNASETEVPVPTDGNEISPVQETSPSDLGLFGPPVGESTPALQEAGDFGVFGPPSDTPTPGLSDPVQPVDTFDAFSPNNEAPGPAVPIEAASETPANDDFDAFASADAPPASMSEAVSADNDDQHDDDGFGKFSADTQDPAQNDTTDDFGQFDDAAVTQAPEMPKTEGFGDFSDFPAPTAAAETDDQFNAFAPTEPASAQTAPEQEPEFDAFDSAPTAQEENSTPPTPFDDGGDDDEDFGEWGAFGGEEDQTAPVSGFPEETSAIEEIKNKVSASGGTLDDARFGGLSVLECINISANGDVHRATRSFLVYHLLSSTHMGNAAAWSKLIEATKNELATCKSLLQEMAKGLTRKDRVSVSKSAKLRIFLEGLREYVRVVRAISASMADLQCLPDDIDLSNLDGWRTTSLLEEAFVVETQWSQMLRAVKKLGIKVDLKLESIPEMRKQTSNLHLDHTDADNYAKMVCNLTLQPLADAVEWNGRSYTAGAANLYANKVSALAPSQ